MATTTRPSPACTICAKERAMYKCSVCRAPYCSVPCYQSHKPSTACSAGSSNDASHGPSPATAPLPPPPSSNSPATANTATLPQATAAAAAQLTALLTQRPALRARLKQVYDTAKHPAAAASGETATGSSHIGLDSRPDERSQEQRTKRSLAMIKAMRDDGTLDSDEVDVLVGLVRAVAG